MTSLMRAEALEAPAAIERMLTTDDRDLLGLVDTLTSDSPRGIVTLARGSSDHAAHYFGYLVMSRLGQLVTSLPMSLITLSPSPLIGQGLLSLAFSQSGQSPDLVEPQAFLRCGGARTVAVVNAEESPLAEGAQWVLPVHAGAERSVAATKSVLAQMAMGAWLVARWQADERLLRAIQGLPDDLARAGQTHWPAFVDELANVDRLIVVGRGLGMSAAMETALKLKETCQIQAEAISGAELRHGPMSLIDEGTALLMVAPRGPAQAGLLALADDLRQRGARVLLVAPGGTPQANLTVAESSLIDLDPLISLQCLYLAIEDLARARGLDPDAPRHLSKITLTR